jgi:hypothetical protein
MLDEQTAGYSHKNMHSSRTVASKYSLSRWVKQTYRTNRRQIFILQFVQTFTLTTIKKDLKQVKKRIQHAKNTWTEILHFLVCRQQNYGEELSFALMS